MNKFALSVAAIFVLSFFAGVSTAQQEAKGEKTNAPTITVFVQNDRVEGRFKTGDKSDGMAKRPARVEFAITDGEMRNYYPDGEAGRGHVESRRGKMV